MSGKKVQWHPGFVAALDLELRDYREFLQFGDQEECRDTDR